LHLTLEPYLIPRFYKRLEAEGVTAQAPRSDFEAFRGSFHGAYVVITIKGEISHSQHQLLRDMIDRIYTHLTDISTPAGDQISKYMILAKHSFPEHSYPVNHLNLWLNPEQFDAAVDLLLDADAIITNSDTIFEDYVFELNGNTISFHENGKVIAEEGYGDFAPILTQAIEQHQPFSEFNLIIGQDEVGTGERIGPVVIGSVASTPSQLTDLQLTGIKDSKMIPRKLSLIMTRWIRDLSTMVSTYQMEPPAFNEKLIGDRLSITDIVAYCHSRGVEQMIDYIQNLEIADQKIIYIVDQFDRNYTIPALEMSKLDFEVKYLPKAERISPSVAAASVVAKAERFRWIQLHEKVFNVALNRKKIKQIRQHHKAHELLKVIG